MKPIHANLIYAAIVAALALAGVWLVIDGDKHSSTDGPGQPGGGPGGPDPRRSYSECVAGILMRDVQVKREDAFKFGSIIADVMKPSGDSGSVEVSSSRSRDLKTVLDKVPPESLKAVLEGCRDAGHAQQGKGFFRGKVTATFDASDKEASGVRITAVSDPAQSCTTNQGACSLPLQSELLAREILVSVSKPGFVLVGATHNKLRISPQALVEDGVDFRLKPWPRLAVHVMRGNRPVVGAPLRVQSAEVWPAGCVGLPGKDSPEECPERKTDETGTAMFETPTLPQIVDVLVGSHSIPKVDVVDARAEVVLDAGVPRDTKCDAATLSAVKNELRVRRAAPGLHAFKVDESGAIESTGVTGMRPIKPDERKLPCEDKVKL